jgi:DNA polymerase-3 subunit alpha
MGKKIPAEMEAQREKLIKGLVSHGMIEKKAEELWRLIEPFAAYGFNKAHAASYGRVAYQTAYMKANYPAEYMTAVLTAESGDIEKVSEIIAECKRMGFIVLPPDVNESFSDFTVVKEGETITKKIRFGLRSIKNFGEEIGKAIITERKTGGPYLSFGNFLERVRHRNLNKKSLEALIMGGAMDSFGERGRLLANLDDALEFNRSLEQQNSAQVSLFGAMPSATAPSFRLKESTEASVADKLRWEKELLGLYVSGHPLEQFREKIEKHDQTVEKIKGLPEGTPVVVAGILGEVKTIMTKKGGKMAFGKLSDFSGLIELVVFTDVYEASKDLFSPDKCVAVKGKISHRNGEPSVVVERLKALE